MRKKPSLFRRMFKKRKAQRRGFNAAKVSRLLNDWVLTLAEFEGENGGYLEVLLSADGLAPVYLLIKEDVDADILDENGDTISSPDVEHEIDPCADASGKFVWIPDTASSFLRLGPTGLTKIHVLAEIVEE